MKASRVGRKFRELGARAAISAETEKPPKHGRRRRHLKPTLCHFHSIARDSQTTDGDF